MKIPDGLIKALATDNGQLRELGEKIGRLYTDKGFPVDMALDRLPYTHEQKIAILNGALGWLIEHRRNSGATDKAIDRQRATNRDIMGRFINNQETGLY